MMENMKCVSVGKMKNEPLRDKELKLPEGLKISPEGFGFFAKKDIKSAVEFWYEYRDEPMKFHDDFEKEFENFLIDELEYERDSEDLIYLDDSYIENKCKEEFNKWLFKYTFKDAIKQQKIKVVDNLINKFKVDDCIRWNTLFGKIIEVNSKDEEYVVEWFDNCPEITTVRYGYMHDDFKKISECLLIALSL